MDRRIRTTCLLVGFLIGNILLNTAFVGANSAPVLSDVTASQRTDDSGIVDIYYTLNDSDGDDCRIAIEISDNGGNSWNISATDLNGDIGAGITPGQRHILWYSKTDLPDVYGTNYQIRITAIDVQTSAYMVYIPAGEFQMGGHHGEGWPAELPVHTVNLDAFCMSKYETTNQQYCDYLNEAYDAGDIKVVSGVVYSSSDSASTYPYFDTHSSSYYSQINFSSGNFSVRTKSGRDMSNDPVVEVSWYGSVAYCNCRSEQEGYQQCYDISDPCWPCDFNKHGYRLPTEAEWEYAARGGEQSPYYRFPWSDTISHTQANYYSYWQEGSPSYDYDINPTSGYHPLWNDRIRPNTSPVGFFDGSLKYKVDYNWPGIANTYQTEDGSNGYGLYDMSGNVWEWCHDRYKGNYYTSSPLSNPTGPISGGYRNRVIRGGGWNSDANRCRVAYRDVIAGPDFCGSPCGFRFVLSGTNYAIGSGLTSLFTIDNQIVPVLSHILIIGLAEVDEKSGSQYFCTAHYSKGSSLDITSNAIWSENSDYASIDSNGYLTTNDVSSDRPCQISVSYEGQSDTYDVMIKDIPQITHLEISGPTQVDEDSIAQYNCTAYYDNDSTEDISCDVVWDVNSIDASIDDCGDLTTFDIILDQTCRITACYQGKSDYLDIIIKADIITLTFDYQGNGIISGEAGEHDYLEIVPLRATPYPGWCVASWHNTDNDSSTAKTNAVTMNESKDVTVIFEHVPPTTISVRQCMVLPGVNPPSGTFIISGSVPNCPSDLGWSKAVQLNFGPYEETISDFVQLGSSYLYRGASGGISLMLLNLSQGSFIILGQNVNLSGLINPIPIEVKFIDYAGEKNYTANNLSLKFMQGFADTLRLDSVQVTANFLMVRGGIAVADTGINLNNHDITISWGNQTFVIPSGNFRKIGTMYLYSDPFGNNGEVSQAIINLNNCTFMITIRDFIIQRSGNVPFCLQFGTFAQICNYSLP